MFARTHVEDGFAVHAQADPRRGHAADPRHHHQLAGQPDRRADLRGRAAHARASSPRAQNIWLVVDLCYEKLIYDPVPHNLPKVLAETCPRAGGDLRVGVEGLRDDRLALRLADRPAAVIAASNAIQSHATSNVTSITQKAAVAALIGSQAPVTAMLDEYRKRRDQLHAWLTADPRLRCRKPAGAFYMFVDISDVLSPDGLRTSLDFADALLEESAGGGHAGRGVRRAGLHPHFVRDVDGATCARAAGGCSSSSRSTRRRRRRELDAAKPRRAISISQLALCNEPRSSP